MSAVTPENHRPTVAAAESGQALPPGLRRRLERSLGADLAQVRWHDDPHAHRMAAGHGADAVASGAHVYFAAGRADLSSEASQRLLAHEVAHLVQQSRMTATTQGGRHLDGGWIAGLESAADRDAERFMRGLAAPAGSERLTVTAARPGPAFVQRHASWEHRLLGDAPTSDLVAIALQQANRTQVLQQILGFLGMWKDDPLSVTPAMINARYPGIRTLTLATSGLLVTYGELNTLPDYMPNPTVLDQQPQSIMLPILQAVRQEGYNWVNWLLGTVLPTSFAYAVSMPTNNAFIDLIAETKALDSLTANVGPAQTNHYTAVVARNACHFAPYSWYRWQQFHMIARDLATQAHASTDSARTAMLTSMAWRNHGYADHFLQDSFAAGHLINKNLVMQWFVEWAATKWYVPVPDWDKVKNMTTGAQPNLAACGLYNRANPGTIFDPQTADEQITLAARMAMTGVTGTPGIPQASAYTNYLAFLNSTVVQSASGVLHDYFNANSLYVGSVANPTQYQIWGDDTLLNGGAGVGIASSTAHLSQQALLDILGSGSTSISVQSVMDCFPSTVTAANGSVVSLQQWNQGLRSQAMGLFPDVHYFVLRAQPYIGSVSVDVAGGQVWAQVQGAGWQIAAGANGAVWGLSAYDVPGTSDRSVMRWNGSGWVTVPGGGLRIAVGIDGLPWLVNSSNVIYHMNSGGAWDEMPGLGTDIACGPDGSVWLLGTNAVPGGYAVYRWTGVTWESHPGGGTRIAVGADGLPWLVNDGNVIFQMTSLDNWVVVPGAATSIAVGQNSDGVPWITTTTQIAGGYTIAALGPGGWVPVEGGLSNLAVDFMGIPWGVNTNNIIFRRAVAGS